MEYPESSNLTVSRDVLCQRIDAESVLLDMKGEVYFRLNGVGTRIWQLLKEECEIDRLINVLGQEFDVSREQLHEDVNELLASMLDKGLVTIR